MFYVQQLKDGSMYTYMRERKKDSNRENEKERLKEVETAYALPLLHK